MFWKIVGWMLGTGLTIAAWWNTLDNSDGSDGCSGFMSTDPCPR